jgi:hypothetical protein
LNLKSFSTAAVLSNHNLIAEECYGDRVAISKITENAEHAFLSYQQQEISPDKLTELALEDAIFKTPQVKMPSYYPPSDDSGKLT